MLLKGNHIYRVPCEDINLLPLIEVNVLFKLSLSYRDIILIIDAIKDKRAIITTKIVTSLFGKNFELFIFFISTGDFNNCFIAKIIY